MAATAMDIPRRPFSVEPLTNIMLPDGIFDTAIFNQKITCFFTNTAGIDLDDVTIYLESVGDIGILPQAKTYNFLKIPTGAAVKVDWLSNFQNATPGKKLVSFIAQAKNSAIKRVIKQIFVSSTTYDEVNDDYVLDIEEGTFKLHYMKVIPSRDDSSDGHGKYCCCCCCKRRGDGKGTHPGPQIPKEMHMAFYPNPGYIGLHGDLPFSDPWWKILAIIIAVIAAIVSVIAAAVSGGSATVVLGGSFDETTGRVRCCLPRTDSSDALDTVAGVAGAISGLAALVAMSDEEDPWWRGQKNTPPLKDEITLIEKVDAVFDYPGIAPNAGAAYPVDVKWRYERETNANSYVYEVAEQQINTHISDGVEVMAPTVHDAFAEPLVINARFEKTGGEFFKGQDLYAFALLVSPGDYALRLDLLDDGIGFDEKANDTLYTCSVHLENSYKEIRKIGGQFEGIWKVYVFAQDVNGATPDMLPEVAATHIGGVMIASSLHLTFDPSLPCPLKAQAYINVVT